YDAGDPERFKEWLRYYRQFVKPTRPSTYLLSCGAGVNSFHVDPKGTLLSCEALPLNGYDLRRGTFKEGWYGIVGDIRKRKAAVTNVCAPCELKGMCDRCPATAVLETGSPDGWIPYYCEITHRRAALFEDSLGNREKASQYLAHADRVKAGWTPPGAILPRADAGSASATACGGGGGCAATGCSKASNAGADTTRLLQIEMPTAPAGTGEEVSR